MDSERVEKLEQISEIQAAEIEALKEVLADLISAHSANNNDVRLIRLIGEDFRHARSLYEDGGTERTPASFFEAKCNAIGKILENAFSSRVFDQFWFRRLLWRSEKQQRNQLAKIRAAIDAEMSK